MNKKLKNVLIIILILVALVLLVLTFFLVDSSRAKNGQKPIFCIKRPGEYLDGGTKEYYGLGYKVICFHTIGGYNEVKIGSFKMQYNDFDEEINDFLSKVVIESEPLEENESKEYMEIEGTEAQEIEQIFSDLNFTTENCGRTDHNYIITIRSEAISYRIGIYTECHITNGTQEAVLSREDSNKLIEIINRHKNNNA